LIEKIEQKIKKEETFHGLKRAFYKKYFFLNEL